MIPHSSSLSLYSERVLSLLCSCTTSSTCQLNGANHNFLRVNQLKTLVVQLANLDSLTKTKRSNVNNQLLGNLIVCSTNFQLTHLQLELTTGTYTFCQTFEGNGHFHNDGLLCCNLIEIDVKDTVCNRVELNVLQHSLASLAIDNEVYRVDVGRIHEVTNFVISHCEVSSNGQIVLATFNTIQYSRDAVSLADFAS